MSKHGTNTDTWLAMKCPACNGQTLFVGNGGYLTCSNVDCPQPDTEAALTTKMELVAKEAQDTHIGRLKVLRAWVYDNKPVYDTAQDLADKTVQEINAELEFVYRLQAHHKQEQA
jgi:hypothetical protein